MCCYLFSVITILMGIFVKFKGEFRLVRASYEKELDIHDIKKRLLETNEQRLELIVKLGEITNSVLRKSDAELTLLNQFTDQLLNLDLEIYQLLCKIDSVTSKCKDCPNCHL